MIWVIVALLLLGNVWFIASLVFSHKRRLHMFNYTLYLLLDDQIRTEEQLKFKHWIRNSGAKNEPQLFNMARQALEAHVKRWGNAVPSTVAAHAKLWNSDAAKGLHSG